MRITESMPREVLLSGIDQLESTILTEQQQLASGQMISQPSDNPVGTAQVLHLSWAQAWNQAWTQAAQGALSFLQTTDGALSQVLSALQAARTVAVQAQSGSANATDLTALANEVTQVQNTLLDLANTQYGDTYVFAGTTGSAPANPQAGTFSLTGPVTLLTFQVGNGVSVPVGADGYAVFIGSGALAAMQKLAADLSSGNISGLGADLQAVQGAIDAITSLRGDLGARMQRVQAVEQQLQQASVSLQSQMATVDSTNVADVITKLAENEAVFQASLAVGAHMLLPTLADYLSQIG